MTTQESTRRPALEVSGDVITPGHTDYDSARRVWNGTVDRRPAAIVRCHSTGDVARTVRDVVRSGLPLAVRGGGHSLPGFSTCDGGVVLDLSRLRNVAVDAELRLARVGGGACWRDVDSATSAHGLATTGGLISSTGVGGLTLGGGIGWLTRRCGLACDNLLSAELVTAGGDVVRAGPDGDAELLWGLRGGGGNFGVVTSFDFRLHPVGAVVAGFALFSAERAREVGAFYRAWVEQLPDELSTMLSFFTAPACDPFPAEVHGRLVVAVVGCHSGLPHAAEADLRPLRELGPALDLFAPTPYTEIQSMFDAEYPAGDRYHFKGGLLDGCSDELIEACLDHMRRRPSSRSELDLHHMGGAVSRVPVDATAFPGRSAPFIYNVIGSWSNPADDEANRAWARAFAADLDRLAGAGSYVNFQTEVVLGSAFDAYGKERLERLTRLKRRYDPDNLFRLNTNVQP